MELEALTSGSKNAMLRMAKIGDDSGVSAEWNTYRDQNYLNTRFVFDIVIRESLIACKPHGPP